MPYILFDYIDANGVNVFRQWSLNLQPKERSKLNAKLDMLRINGEVLFPHILTDTDVPGILKLRVKGQVQLRPLLCRGPIKVKTDFTLLMGAKEVGDEIKPKKAFETADSYKQQVIADPKNRRVPHERVG